MIEIKKIEIEAKVKDIGVDKDGYVLREDTGERKLIITWEKTNG